MRTIFGWLALSTSSAAGFCSVPSTTSRVRTIMTSPKMFNGIPLLGQTASYNLDQDLMSVPGFSVDQLMELAGLSIASAVHDAYPERKRVLAIVGPGNNGGDALVAVRHLKHFGWEPFVVYPKFVKKPLFENLVTQVEQLDIPVETSLPKDFNATFDLVLDGIFGFSFKPEGGIRAPFDKIIDQLLECDLPIAAIDIPSGWDVEKGNTAPSPSGKYLEAEMLISLTAPKEGTRFFTGKFHYLGGRFVPPFIVEKYHLQGLPKYHGSDQFLRLDWSHSGDATMDSKL